MSMLSFLKLTHHGMFPLRSGAPRQDLCLVDNNGHREGEQYDNVSDLADASLEHWGLGSDAGSGSTSQEKTIRRRSSKACDPAQAVVLDQIDLECCTLFISIGSHVFHDSKFSEMGYSGSLICFLSKYSSDMFDDSKISHPGSALMTALLTEYSNCNDSQFSPSKLVLQLLKATK
ncbi:uncharacterized protein LACBIDRAFT_321434 [Laccaria bicolor S238N-H82]|uniref:Predicted protein n=1 Tax=Laccaria bicolor (strain S238N-H82 / ATCC MYA-4686) TaxID=486041 RepID=B0CQC7_LACBS|nr:uncharacterized protein LACBIDRAFT_321434 [Laccaria bicolor S238N-H82]EDR16183.1 predicted protein [Laccaria bicolor S238N-H82]|eukprot:XP_001874391.1 predicted protein [Laccaria bicolor S238N-H82]